MQEGEQEHSDHLNTPFTHVYLLLVNVCMCVLPFSTGYGECLLDEPVSRTYELPNHLPGQIYNANRQCELMFGPGSMVCPYMVSQVAFRSSQPSVSQGGTQFPMGVVNSIGLWSKVVHYI